MKLTIDRFEGNFAVCEREDRKMINIEKTNIAAKAREGDKIELVKGEYIVCDNAKEKNNVETLFRSLLNK